jgi:hypothetical protein
MVHPLGVGGVTAADSSAPGWGTATWMKPAELDQELRHPGAAEVLRSSALARLGYTGLDGFPRVIPIGFAWDGAQLVVCTATTSPKVRALAANGHVALTIDTESAKALLLRGMATLEPVDGVPDEFIEASKKSMDPNQLPAFEAQVRNLYKQMVRISVRPQWARFYDFGAGRVPRFLAELAGNA